MDPIAPGHAIQILAAMQGHPKAPRLWAEHVDRIIQKLELVPVHHEPCLYSGSYKGAGVQAKCKVEDFEIATAQPQIAEEIFDKVDDYLTFPLRRMGLLALFNGIDVLQTRDYIKISVINIFGEDL